MNLQGGDDASLVTGNSGLPIACGEIKSNAIHGHGEEATKSKALGPGSITIIFISTIFVVGLGYWYFFRMHKDNEHRMEMDTGVVAKEEFVALNTDGATLNVSCCLLILLFSRYIFLMIIPSDVFTTFLSLAHSV